MRIFTVILATAAISSALTFAFLKRPDSSPSSATAKSAEQNQSNEKPRPSRQLLSARQKSATTSTEPSQPTTQKAQAPRAADIIRQLTDAQTQTGSRFSVQRKIIHGFESLAALGDAALPDITAYLSTNQDVDYAKSGIVNDSVNWWSMNRAIATPAPIDSREAKPSAEELAKKAAEEMLRQQNAYKLGPTEYFCPLTLRLGLIETLGRLNKAVAEQALAEQLRYTESSNELVLIDHLLERLAPGKYRQDTLAAAREGLSQPRLQPTINNEEWRKDWGNRTRLYALLVKHGDASFVNEAQSQLLMANGQIDSEALNYLQRTLKEQSIPYLIQATRNLDDSKTNYAARALSSAIVRYAGENPAADQYFLDTMQGSQSLQSKTSTLYGLQQLTPLTQEGAQRRLQLLDKVESSVADEALKQHFKHVRRALEYQRDAKNLAPNSLSYQWNGNEGVRIFSSGDFSRPAIINVQPVK